MIGAEDPGQISRRHGGLIDYLEPLLDQRRSTLDHAQIAALERLQQLADDLVAFRDARKSPLRRLTQRMLDSRLPPAWPRVTRSGRKRRHGSGRPLS